MDKLNYKYTFHDNPLGEGFYVDRVVKEKNIELGTEYFKYIRIARHQIKTGKISPNALEALHRYNRIFEWIRFKYGSIPCASAESSETITNSKILELIMFEGDCWDFWEWLRETTLNESSRMVE